MNLLEEYGKKFRVTLEESYSAEHDTEARKEKWRYHQIRGKYGILYPYSKSVLHIFTDSESRISQFKKQKLKVIKMGDGEAVFEAPSDIQGVLSSISARKRRQVSPEQVEAFKLRVAKHQFKKKSTLSNALETGKFQSEA